VTEMDDQTCETCTHFPPSPARATPTRGRSHPRRPGNSRTWRMTANCRFERYDDLMLELPPGSGDHGMPLV